MKKIALIIAVTLLSVFAMIWCYARRQNATVSEKNGCAVSYDEGRDVTVYVVASPYGRSFHRDRWCVGLRRATHEVVAIDSIEALRRHFRACKICYSGRNKAVADLPF